jgi:hypothetical protein
MLTKLRKNLRMTWNRVFTSTIPKLPTRNTNLPTKTSWAELIKSLDDVPDVFKDFFEATLTAGREFPYTILTPGREGFVSRMMEALICDFGNEIFVLERDGNTYDVKCFPLEGINWVQVRTILLDSSIKINGLTKQGILASSTLSFNSVTDYLFVPILGRMRRTPVDSHASPQSSELEKFDPWLKVNFKFMNYAKHSMLAGDKVIHTILQPEIRETVFKFLGKTYARVLSPTLASILTDRELIMIREEKRGSGEDKYGGIWDYIPAEKIITLFLDEVDKDLLAFSIQLSEGTRLEYLFQASAKRELNLLQDRLKELALA